MNVKKVTLFLSILTFSVNIAQAQELLNKKLEELLPKEGIVKAQIEYNKTYPFIDKANKLIKNKDLIGAINEYKKFLENIDKNNPLILWNLVLLYEQTGDYNDLYKYAKILQ